MSDPCSECQEYRQIARQADEYAQQAAKQLTAERAARLEAEEEAGELRQACKTWREDAAKILHAADAYRDLVVARDHQIAALREGLECAAVDLRAHLLKYADWEGRIAAALDVIVNLRALLERAECGAGAMSEEAQRIIRRLDHLEGLVEQAKREDAELRVQLAAAHAACEADEQERDTLMRLLESLTPGGSEFYANPKNCAAWVTDQQSSSTRVAVEAVIARRAAEQERDDWYREFNRVHTQLAQYVRQIAALRERMARAERLLFSRGGMSSPTHREQAVDAARALLAQPAGEEE